MSFDLFLDFFFPRTSLTGREGEWITEDERRHLASKPVLLGTGQLRALGLTSLDRVVAGSSYADAPLLRKAIHTLKYKHISALAEDLGQILLRASTLSWSTVQPVLCPVPLHWTRRFQRGFNQAELLASVVAGQRQCPMDHLLARIRPTGFQAKRNRKERFVGVKDAFRMSVTDVPPFVVLVDDLSTTGATLDACAEVLKRAGAKRVEGLVVAHG